MGFVVAAVFLALLAWGAYALMRRAYKLAVSPRPAAGPEEQVVSAACEAGKQGGGGTMETAEAAVAGRFPIPWGAIVFVAVLWIAGRRSSANPMLFIPIIGIALLVTIGRFFGRATSYYSKPTPKGLADQWRALIWILAVILGAAGIVHGRHYLIRDIEKTMAPLIAAADSFCSKTGKYPAYPDELVPDYIAAIPRCPDRCTSKQLFFRTLDDGYTIGCLTDVFMQYTYYSKTKRWGMRYS